MFITQTCWTRERDGKPHLLLEHEPPFHRQAVRFRDGRNHVHNLAQLLQHDSESHAASVQGY